MEHKEEGYPVPDDELYKDLEFNSAAPSLSYYIKALQTIEENWIKKEEKRKAEQAEVELTKLLEKVAEDEPHRGRTMAGRNKKRSRSVDENDLQCNKRKLGED